MAMLKWCRKTLLAWTWRVLGDSGLLKFTSLIKDHAINKYIMKKKMRNKNKRYQNLFLQIVNTTDEENTPHPH